MTDMRPQASRAARRRICGEARHHARWREPSSDEEAAAVAAPRELGGGIGLGHTRDCRKNGRFPYTANLAAIAYFLAARAWSTVW